MSGSDLEVLFLFLELLICCTFHCTLLTMPSIPGIFELFQHLSHTTYFTCSSWRSMYDFSSFALIQCFLTRHSFQSVQLRIDKFRPILATIVINEAQIETPAHHYLDSQSITHAKGDVSSLNGPLFCILTASMDSNPF